VREKQCISYIIPHDSGKAPNPWWNNLTLGVCKPVIRRTAEENDLIVGLSFRGQRLVYVMYVAEILTFGEYFHDPRFYLKKPNFVSNDSRRWMGDNFYEPTGKAYIQHVSPHHVQNRTQIELQRLMDIDLSGLNVLVASLFWYFGDFGPELPEELSFLRIRRGHRLSGERGMLAVERYVKVLLGNPGIHGMPKLFNETAQKLKHLHGQKQAKA